MTKSLYLRATFGIISGLIALGCGVWMSIQGDTAMFLGGCFVSFMGGRVIGGIVGNLLSD